jgi:tRNA nucleotidyltransferase (CCA-adding enzyme)
VPPRASSRTATATSPRRSQRREPGLGIPRHASDVTEALREDLARRLEALPAARPLLERLADVPDVHLVGGSVRDLLLGEKPVDLDLVVEGDPADVQARLARGSALRIHDRFGTFTAQLDGFTYDVARSRRERYPRPGALPEVEPAPLSEDLGRRDFTVNAMAIRLTGPDAGALSAVPSARDDLAAHVLRVLHERSFQDDPTRLLRLARYRGRLGFTIEPQTRGLAERATAGGVLSTVSGSRIGAELRMLAREQDPIAAFAALRELSLDQAIHPWLGIRDPDLARSALELVPSDGRPDRLALAVAALGIPAEELEQLLDRLAFEAGDRDAVLAAATQANELAGRLAQANRPSEIAAAVGGGGPELAALAGALGPRDAARSWLDRLRKVRLEIDGADLLAAGVPEGPALGRGLRAALAAKLDGITTGREAELAIALKAAAEETGEP